VAGFSLEVCETLNLCQKSFIVIFFFSVVLLSLRVLLHVAASVKLLFDYCSQIQLVEVLSATI